MLGPNPGAGIKILIHENKEVPLVRDLGHAIPPGTHAYVAIQITEVGESGDIYPSNNHNLKNNQTFICSICLSSPNPCASRHFCACVHVIF